MNIQTVAQNLRNTIAGKEALLAEWKSVKATLDPMMYQTLVPMLELNIDELNRILDDLVECQVTGINLTWQQNPDRSGGQFTQDEINRSGEWR